MENGLRRVGVRPVGTRADPTRRAVRPGARRRALLLDEQRRQTERRYPSHVPRGACGACPGRTAHITPPLRRVLGAPHQVAGAAPSVPLSAESKWPREESNLRTQIRSCPNVFGVSRRGCSLAVLDPLRDRHPDALGRVEPDQRVLDRRGEQRFHGCDGKPHGVRRDPLRGSVATYFTSRGSISTSRIRPKNGTAAAPAPAGSCAESPAAGRASCAPGTARSTRPRSRRTSHATATGTRRAPRPHGATPSDRVPRRASGRTAYAADPADRGRRRRTGRPRL
jgi:hypothetical protein